MDQFIIEQLLALNRNFYTQFAHDFSETRAVARTNIQPILPYLENGAKVLDVGCGNGRLAERLDRAGLALSYVGIDFTPELIEIARVRNLSHLVAEFHAADITTREWQTDLQTYAPFDAAIALAVLHHIPSFEWRCVVLQSIRALLKPNGTLVLSNWQFMQNARLRKKIVSWQTVGIDEHALEEGDALLDWQRGGTGYRYVHQLTESQVQALAAQSGWHVIEQFYADADMNLWSLLKAI